MTRPLRRIDWAALGASVGASVLFALLASMPFLLGVHLSYWLIVAAVGVGFGVYFYLRGGHDEQPGPDADEVRFPR